MYKQKTIVVAADQDRHLHLRTLDLRRHVQNQTLFWLNTGGSKSLFETMKLCKHLKHIHGWIVSHRYRRGDAWFENKTVIS